MTLATLITATILSQELHCGALISYYEARGEDTYAAKVAPVIVARNRVVSDEFPNTMCEVMNQSRQFAFVTDDLHLSEPMDREAWETAQKASQDVFDMPIHPYERPMNGALYFHSGSPPNWDYTKIEKTVTIGRHRFYANREN